MSTRKTFLTAAAALPFAAAVPAGAAAPQSTPTPAVPTPRPTPKPPSDAARALAAFARRFDAQLSDKNVEDIARGIDYNLSAGRAVNPKGRALKNSDEPVTTFSVPE